jgi:hypothetical protein
MTVRDSVPALSRRPIELLIGTAVLAVLSGCVATAPKMGENKGTVTGAAGGASSENANSQLERCDQPFGTMALQEDVNAPWYFQLRQFNLGSTLPVLRLMIQQSNCFVIVDRGRAMANMQMERDLAKSGEVRAGSNFGAGQMVAADYTLSPEIQFSGTTGGGGLGAIVPGVLGALAASVKQNEASTTLLLIDNRSGVQVSASEGTAKNMDFGLFGAAFTGGLAAGGGGYSRTPEGKVIVAAFADSFNQMVKALRNYTAQAVKGGLGTGGNLSVQGAQPVSTASPAAPVPQMTVGQAQQRLNALGYPVGTADGMIGPRTRAQLTKFQKDQGIPQTGELDAATIQKLSM